MHQFFFVSVQVFNRADIPILRSAIEEVMSKLNSHSDLIVKYEQVPDIALVNPDNPLFVFCVNTSRLGTDAANAVKGMKRKLSGTCFYRSENIYSALNKTKNRHTDERTDEQTKI